MEKYLIIIDLDGTTLCDDKTIHPKTKESIKKICELGHKVVISTGRPFYSSFNFYNELQLDTLIVNRNGGHVHNPIKKDINHSTVISKNIVDNIINSKIYNYIQEIYLEHKNDLCIVKGKLEFFEKRNYLFDKVYNYTEKQDATLMLMLVDNDKIDEVNNFLDTIDNIRYDCWRHNGEYKSTMYEIFPLNVSKDKAFDILIDYYNIPINRTIAIGDQINDIEMIKNVHIGVAVKNAIDKLKQCANIITKYDNNNGAVGFFLEEYFKLK